MLNNFEIAVNGWALSAEQTALKMCQSVISRPGVAWNCRSCAHVPWLDDVSGDMWALILRAPTELDESSHFREESGAQSANLILKK